MKKGRKKGTVKRGYCAHLNKPLNYLKGKGPKFFMRKWKRIIKWSRPDTKS